MLRRPPELARITGEVGTGPDFSGYRINQEFGKVARNYTDVAILKKPSLVH